MGRMTLDQFRSTLLASLGDRGVGNDRLDIWINQAYEEVATAIEFEAAQASTTLTTVLNQASYSLPAGLLGIRGIVDETNDRNLVRMDWQEYLRKNPDSDVNGEPTHWVRHNDKVYLHPTPDTAGETLSLYYEKELTALSSGSDKTAIPGMWDKAILLLAQASGLQDLKEFEGAQLVFSRAMGYMRSRRTDDQLAARNSAVGVQVAWSEEDLIDQGN